MDTILIIDDDAELCELLADYLGSEGFIIETANRGDDGAEKALKNNYLLIILDVMLPGINGFDVLRKIRESSSVPIIMLTARGDDIDRIVGLELGADDYLPKPFNPRELLARINAIARRTKNALEHLKGAAGCVDVVKIGDICLRNADRSVQRGVENINLTAVEFNLLEILLTHAGEVVNRELLVEKVLGRQLAAYDRSIDVHVSALRKKLGPASCNTERIKTIRGVGYLYAIPREQSDAQSVS